jgi:vanillate O-demethylase monooxygenase subunit
MRADLSKGCVVGGVLHCPLHDWQYDGDGRCVRIPASTEVPPFARQAVYPTVEFGGHIAFYNSPVADFPMPFFEGCSPSDLHPAKPFEFVVNTPWYMVAANAFDLQHFRIAHDRTLMDTPIVDCLSLLRGHRATLRPAAFGATRSHADFRSARRMTATVRADGHLVTAVPTHHKLRHGLFGRWENRRTFAPRQS